MNKKVLFGAAAVYLIFSQTGFGYAKELYTDQKQVVFQRIPGKANKMQGVKFQKLLPGEKAQYLVKIRNVRQLKVLMEKYITELNKSHDLAKRTEAAMFLCKAVWALDILRFDIESGNNKSDADIKYFDRMLESQQKSIGALNSVLLDYSDDRDLRLKIVRFLSFVRHPYMQDALVTLSNTELDEEIRDHAVMNLGDFRNIEAVEQLIHIFENDKSAGVRVKAAQGIARILLMPGSSVYTPWNQKKAAKALILSGLEHKDKQVKKAAIIALGDIKYRPALYALREIEENESEDKEIREAARDAKQRIKSWENNRK